MALITGSPVGSITSQEEIYLSSAPYIYFQDSTATPLKNPDADGFYWGLSGTTAYPVFSVGCPNDVSLTENLASNDILCDNVGVSNTILQRNYVDFIFTVQTLLPLTTLRHLLKGGVVTQTSPTQKFGFGQPNNSLFYHVYAPMVYDDSVGDYVWIYLHKCKFVDAFTISMTFGQNWKVTGLKLRAYADSTKPSPQLFGMFGRSDLSAIP